jgi:3-hydroxymyristoyl/3-hydroxydecanoyl-(acyl carrier protein) dehydratase
MSFLFVDRITELVPEKRARGELDIPLGGEDFPSCFTAEAIGQLAAWVAMQRAGFRSRPVAARVGEVRVRRTAPAGSRLELGVEIASAKSVAIAYRGWARLDGETIVELSNSVGAMLPMEEFEASEEARGQFERLLGTGLLPRSFPSRAAYEPEIETRLFERDRLEARLRVPDDGALYADHFPRRPVYPATLLLDAQLRLAKRLVAGQPDARIDVAPATVRNVKVRSFTAPGASLDVRAERRPVAPGEPTTIELTACSAGKTVGTGLAILA